MTRMTGRLDQANAAATLLKTIVDVVIAVATQRKRSQLEERVVALEAELAARRQS